MPSLHLPVLDYALLIVQLPLGTMVLHPFQVPSPYLTASVRIRGFVTRWMRRSKQYSSYPLYSDRKE